METQPWATRCAPRATITTSASEARFEAPDLLLLDEPTNHLSLALVTEFEAALADHAGALVLITHDRALRDTFSGTMIEISEGRVDHAC